jgi:uncharacterized membrane protein HdeD (DUF308 family)
MIRTLIKNWWLLALRSLLAAIFSVAAFLMRSTAESYTLQEFATKGITVLFGIMATAAGVCTVLAAIWRSREGKSWLLMLDGLCISAVGVLLILSHSISFSTVVLAIVALAMIIGVVELAAARLVRRHVPDEWFLVCAGIGSLAFGLAFFMVRPQEAASALVWLGSYSGFSAICMAGLALRFRNMRASVHKLAGGSSHG